MFVVMVVIRFIVLNWCVLLNVICVLFFMLKIIWLCFFGIGCGWWNLFIVCFEIVMCLDILRWMSKFLLLLRFVIMYLLCWWSVVICLFVRWLVIFLGNGYLRFGWLIVVCVIILFFIMGKSLWWIVLIFGNLGIVYFL